MPVSRPDRSRSPPPVAPSAVCGRCGRAVAGLGHCLPEPSGALLSVCLACYLVEDLGKLQRSLPEGPELNLLVDGLQVLWETARAAAETEAGR
jgi:hypothetical protein